MHQAQSTEHTICQQIADILQDAQRKVLKRDCEVIVIKNDNLAYNQTYVVDALTRFVDAYFNIRERIVGYETDTRKIRDQAYAEGLQAGFAHATTHEFISIDALRAMTLQELAQLLHTDE